MSGLLSSSIGKKVIMSLTGLFLIVFLLVHLTVNLLTLVGEETFNAAAHFMGHNPVMKVIEPFLAIGFLIHILYSIVLTIQNMKARPVGYSVSTKGLSSSWSSRNMLILGGLIFIALVVHIMDYFYKIKFTDELNYTTEFQLVISKFSPENWYYVAIYLVWFVFLGLHLNHALQSAFQTLGLNNKFWQRRWKVIGTLYSLLVAVGFAIIPIYFLIVQLQN